MAFVGEWTAPVLRKVASLFSQRHPDCVAHVHEAQLANTRSSLVDGSIDILIASYPFDGMACAAVRAPRAGRVHRSPTGGREVGIAGGPRRASRHPVPGDHLGGVQQRPDTRPHSLGPARAEGARGKHVLRDVIAGGPGSRRAPRREYTRRYYPHPDVTYVPIHDAPPIERGPVWLKTNTTARVREFVRAAVDANIGPSPDGTAAR